MPRELLWIGVVVLVVGINTAVRLVPPLQIIEGGVALMLGSAAPGIPLQVVYFGALAFALHRRGVLPRGWYWRTFDHHKQLIGRERPLVLVWFWLGFACFVGIVLGIATTLLGLVVFALQ